MDSTEQNPNQKEQQSSSTKRIARNTLMLYVRQFLIMLVGLYTVRVILGGLGVEDYGIWNLVAGIVTMFGFLSGSMATATQRYLSFDLGIDDKKSLNETFSISLYIYVLLTVVVILLAETIGLWFVKVKLTIPSERIFAALVAYQFSILSFAATMLASPYLASLIAHEDMDIYATISIVEVVLKLGVAIAMAHMGGDKLIIYGSLLCGASIVVTLIYIVICHSKYDECTVRRVWNKKKFNDLMSFMGWNLFGAGSAIGKNQLVNILLNQYFNPVLIAARSIALRVNSAVTSFSSNFSVALRPQIIKQYAAQETKQACLLVFRGCKFTFFLMYIFTVPLLFGMEVILQLWLTTVPPLTVIFTRLMLIDALCESVSYPLMTLAQANGNIKLYQSVVGGILLMNFPISWVVLALGAPPVSIMYVSISITVISFFVRLLLVHRLVSFSYMEFFKVTFLPIIGVVGVTLFILLSLHYVWPWHTISGKIGFFFFCIIIILCGICALGLTQPERRMVMQSILKKLHRQGV